MPTSWSTRSSAASERLKRGLVVAGAVVLAAAGCRTAGLQGDVDAFAAVGGRYAEAVDAVLAEAAGVLVEASSVKLLEARDLAAAERDWLVEQDEAVRESLEELRLLRRQVALVGDYFTALARLADPRAAEALALEVAATVAALDDLASGLREGRSTGGEAAAAAAEVGRIAVHRGHARYLRRELEARRQTVAEILLLHEELLAAVEEQVRAELELLTAVRYEEQVAAPFLDPTALATEASRRAWMRRRLELLSAPAPAESVEAARHAARDLRHAWIGLVGGGLRPADLEALAADLEAILAALGAG